MLVPIKHLQNVSQMGAGAGVQEKRVRKTVSRIK